ncbi:MAG TPA: rRNA maturation RNase YbeY [Balneolaceae bacterium]|nr:rRNA maturation RNase YbeY [Balneolaceae bacterium]
MKNFPSIPGNGAAPGLEFINQTDESIPVADPLLKEILQQMEKSFGVRFQMIELVYVDENEIVRINREFLGKEYITDIITFPYHDPGSTEIEGTLFCCAPRIVEQSRELGTESRQEFYRVFIHGMLHLCGFDDATPGEKEKMSELENNFLNKINL